MTLITLGLLTVLLTGSVPLTSSFSDCKSTLFCREMTSGFLGQWGHRSSLRRSDDGSF